MLFNSYIFIFLFLPLTFFIYFFLLKKNKTMEAKSFLIFSSLFFYSWWNIIYLPLILFSMFFNYTFGVRVKGKKGLLILGVISNLLLLGYFKYSDFFIENMNNVFSTQYSLLNLALPLAISFFTFQQIAYLVDSYRGETKEYDFLNYALFVTFFPQLIAGPIVHHKEMMPQFSNSENMLVNYHHVTMGLFVFSMGLFKKTVIADTFGLWVAMGFANSEALTFLEAWATSLSYTFQLYFDFSGYTDMAIGAALLFNIKLPINFNSPYKANNIQDFWRRWHITLSRFLRDYIYIPLGGSRVGEFRIYTNLMITFIIGGLWHGAGWIFIFWGLLHGLALVVYSSWRHLHIKLWTWFSWFITFNFVNVGWVFFRAEKWDDAIFILKAMISFENIVMINPLWLIALLLSFIVTLGFKNSIEVFENFTFGKREAIHIAFLLVSSFVAMRLIGGQSEFLYFNF